MRAPIARSSVLCSVVAAFALALAPTGRAQQIREVRLADAVPEDVFLFTAGWPNPERAFLDAYWGEVWQAVVDSDVPHDLIDLLLGATGEEARPEVERLRQRYTDLVTAVPWGELVAGESAFAERLSPVLPILRGSPVTPVEYVVLFRADPGTVAAAFEGLDALLEALVVDIAELGGARMELSRSTQGGVQLVGLDLTQLEPDAPGVLLAAGRHQDVLFLALGHRLPLDVADLVSGQGRSPALGTSERFRGAFATLPAAEDALTWFDMRNLRSELGALTDRVLEAVAADVADVADRVANTGQDEQASALLRAGLAAYERGELDDALRLHLRAHELDPADSRVLYNLACLRALRGEHDEALTLLEQAVEAGFWAPRRIAADRDLQSLRGAARFEAALEAARAGAGRERQGWIATARGLSGYLFESMGLLDAVASVTSTEGYSTTTDSVARLSERAEANPLYRVFCERPPLGELGRYVPREAGGFAADEGLSLPALYAWIEGGFEAAGEPGERAWEAWTAFQEEHGFDVRADLLAWLDTASLRASFEHEGRDGWIFFLRVTDEDGARAALARAFEALPRRIDELAARLPPLALLKPRLSPAADARLEGFQGLAFAMMQSPALLGVHDGWLMLGSSEQALLLALDTAAGEHESVLANEAVVARALLPEGPLASVAFADRRDEGREAALVLSGVLMAAGLNAAAIPDPQARELATGLVGVLSRLAPLLARIDFFDSTASAVRFDGRAWRTRTVTHYVPPDERGPARSEH